MAQSDSVAKASFKSISVFPVVVRLWHFKHTGSANNIFTTHQGIIAGKAVPWKKQVDKITEKLPGK